MLRETEKDLYDRQEVNKEAEVMVRSDGPLLGATPCWGVPNCQPARSSSLRRTTCSPAVVCAQSKS